MIESKKFFVAGLIVIGGFVGLGCSSGVKQADIPSTANPQEEIARLDKDLNLAVSKNIDVLAPDEFKKGRGSFEEAKKDLANKEKQEEILGDIRVGRGYLEKAYDTAANREEKAPGLFLARQAALNAGANKFPELAEELNEADSDVSAKAHKLEATSTDDLSKWQAKYVTLERKAVIISQLGNARATVTGAKNDGGAKLAPLTYKKAELSLKTAESVISTNVTNPAGYQTAVVTANADATLLMDVWNTQKQNKGLSETAALKMVAQNRQINAMKTDAATTATSNAAAASAAALAASTQSAQMATEISARDQALAAQDQELAAKDQTLTAATAQVEVQRALEQARKEFSADEAEAYQQGGNLVIRLKKVNFASGRSDLPSASLPLLGKVSEVAKSLKASEIKVEGHTDSVGAEAMNKSISEQRAGAVASYLKSNGFGQISVQSEGYGFAKPIATNKSKEGRAQNRRVDVIITPATATR